MFVGKVLAWGKPQHHSFTSFELIHWEVNLGRASLQWPDTQDEVWPWWPLSRSSFVSYPANDSPTGWPLTCHTTPLLSSASALRRKCFDGDSTAGLFWKMPRCLITVPMCLQRERLLRGPLLSYFAADFQDPFFFLFFEILKGAPLFFNRRRFQPGGEINDFVSTSRLIYPPLDPSCSH